MNELVHDRASDGGDADGGAGETAVLVSAECLRLTPAAPMRWLVARPSRRVTRPVFGGHGDAHANSRQ
jgi:hypothetical protein